MTNVRCNNYSCKHNSCYHDDTCTDGICTKDEIELHSSPYEFECVDDDRGI